MVDSLQGTTMKKKFHHVSPVALSSFAMFAGGAECGAKNDRKNASPSDSSGGGGNLAYCPAISMTL
jgi:hypothetical protein